MSKQSWHNVERGAYMLPYQVRQCSIGMKPSPVRAASIDSRLYISPISNLRLIDGVMVIIWCSSCQHAFTTSTSQQLKLADRHTDTNTVTHTVTEYTQMSEPQCQ